MVVHNTGHGGQRGAAEGTEEGAGALPARAGGEERRLLQHHLAPRGRQAGGAPEDGAKAGRGPGGPALRAHQGGLAWASAATARAASPGARTGSTWSATRSRRPR